MRKRIITGALAMAIGMASSVTPSHADPIADKALCDAAYEGTPATIGAAAKRGGQVAAICKGWGNTPLAIAALQGNADNVGALLALGAAADQADDSQYTALMLSHSAAVTRALLAHGADPGRRNKYDSTALISAGSIAEQISEQDAIDIAQMLLDKGADINESTKDDGDTVLLSASQSKHNGYIEFLIGHGANVNARNSSNNTPLDIVLNAQNNPIGGDPAAFRETERILRAHGGIQ